jgi:hypothetical protein
MAEAKGRIARNRALTSDDLADPIGWNPDLPRKFTGSAAQFYNLYGEDLAGMNRSTHYVLLSMVIDNFDVQRPSGARRPSKANPPLLVDANVPLSTAPAFQRFETVAGESAKIIE